MAAPEEVIGGPIGEDEHQGKEAGMSKVASAGREAKI